MNLENVKIIAFDADDTLWHNESIFRRKEQEFCELFTQYLPISVIMDQLYEVEVKNIPIYGYGVKGFTLSMLETAMSIPGVIFDPSLLSTILEIGRSMLNLTPELLPGVTSVLSHLSQKYHLILITKGDLFEQEKKIVLSGLSNFFQSIEIVSEKHKDAYLEIAKQERILPEELLMVGNSLKSDILPVLSIGGVGVHVPYPILWQHEFAEFDATEHNRFIELASLSELVDVLT